MITILRLTLWEIHNYLNSDVFKQTYFRLFEPFAGKSKFHVSSISLVNIFQYSWVSLNKINLEILILKLNYTLRANIFSSQFNENVNLLSSSLAIKSLIWRGANSMLPGIPRKILNYKPNQFCYAIKKFIWER